MSPCTPQQTSEAEEMEKKDVYGKQKRMSRTVRSQLNYSFTL